MKANSAMLFYLQAIILGLVTFLSVPDASVGAVHETEKTIASNDPNAMGEVPKNADVNSSIEIPPKVSRKPDPESLRQSVGALQLTDFTRKSTDESIFSSMVMSVLIALVLSLLAAIILYVFKKYHLQKREKVKELGEIEKIGTVNLSAKITIHVVRITNQNYAVLETANASTLYPLSSCADSKQLVGQDGVGSI